MAALQCGADASPTTETACYYAGGAEVCEMSTDVDAVMATLQIVLKEVERQSTTGKLPTHIVNKWIGQLPGVWTGRWRRLAIMVLFFCAPTIVSGHSWYDADCCSDKDCFPAENVVYYSYDRSYTADVHGRHVRVGPEVKKLPSRDGSYHACLRDRPGMPVRVKCWYVPANTQRQDAVEVANVVQPILHIGQAGGSRPQL